eukprot:scaffold19493_cov101-Isochrysis_galbana.AAC.2
MSISSYASDSSADSQPLSHEFSLSNPSRQSGMVQPVVQEMFATVHAAGSSLLGLFIQFMHNLRFDTLALAHDARTKQLLAISRGEPPLSLNVHRARLSPVATLDDEAELLFSDTYIPRPSHRIRPHTIH